LGGNELAPVRERDGPRATPDPELPQDALDVRAHRLRADDELGGDLGRREAVGEQRETSSSRPVSFAAMGGAIGALLRRSRSIRIRSSSGATG
jgi:hypothetical protein